MCRTGGRRCPSHSDPVAVAARNARRREQYAARKGTSFVKPVVSGEAPIGGISLSQKQYFEKSKAVDVNGNLVKLYHGSGAQFNSFDVKTVGRGNDSWGNGFYFTDQENIAWGYANETGSPDANVKEFYLNLENPILVDGITEMSLVNFNFTKKQTREILLQNPLLRLQPDYDGDEMNPLGDYVSEFWDKDHHSDAELNRMIDKMVDEYFGDGGTWVELESLYGKEYGHDFLKAVHNATGYDGVIVDFGEEVGKHYVAWFPNQMKLTNNLEPDDSDLF